MARVTYPPGDTTASRVKALTLWVRRTRDKAAAEALLREVRIDAEYIADETRPIPVVTWHRALTAFAAKFSSEAIKDTWPSVIDPENLGVWTRVLRGTVDPVSALAQLESYGGDELKTARWEVISAQSGRWHGRVILSHDPMLERDGLCGLARAAELRALPALFGYGPATVRIVAATKTGGVAARTAGHVEEYIVEWSVPNATRGAALAAAVGMVATSPSMLVEGVGRMGAVLVTGAALFAGALGAARQSNLLRRAESQAQLNRIRALERSVALKENRERAAVGFFEGSVIAGKYRLGRKLGAGASGVIHQATRLADNAPVAIKLLRAAVAHDTVASDRLRREAEALGLTWHPNVVEVFEHDHLPDGTAYLVMEQLDGESLATRLSRDAPLSPEQTASIITQVCDALGAVHAAGVIHRDVKPSNIFLATRGEGFEVKLIDFGIARVEWAETRLTNMGSPLGTPGYMSPEQEQGGDIDARSDLYALGAVMFECFVGAPPPTTVSGSFEIAHPGAPPVPGNRMSARVPPEWRAVIHRAMALLPQGRYRDARAMREAVASLVQVDLTGPSSVGPVSIEAEIVVGTRSATEVRKTNVSK